MREIIYKIFDIGRSKRLGMFCFIPFMLGCFLPMFVNGSKPIENYNVILFSIILASPLLFFIAWFIFAIIVLSIEKLIIAIEFVVYELGIPNIKINVNVIWKYQQK